MSDSSVISHMLSALDRYESREHSARQVAIFLEEYANALAGVDFEWRGQLRDRVARLVEADSEAGNAARTAAALEDLRALLRAPRDKPLGNAGGLSGQD